jgi:hypothetical protein
LLAAGPRHAERVNWLVASIVASVVLTIVLNVGLRAFPGAGDRAARRMETWAAPEPADRDDPYAARRPQRRVRVFFPWKAMLIGSLLLTLLLNVMIRLG